jgi:hypothetical protein
MVRRDESVLGGKISESDVVKCLSAERFAENTGEGFTRAAKVLPDGNRASEKVGGCRVVVPPRPSVPIRGCPPYFVRKPVTHDYIRTMSVEQIEQSLLKLDRDERRRFADWFFANAHELTGPDYIHPEVKTEILRRREEVDAHPELLEPWEGKLEGARERLNEFRRQKAPPR